MSKKLYAFFLGLSLSVSASQKGWAKTELEVKPVHKVGQLSEKAGNKKTERTNFLRTVFKSFRKTLPESVRGALTLDVPTLVAMHSLGLAPLSLPVVALRIGASVAGYSLRKTCNDVLKPGSNNVECGFLGGSIKYGLLGGFTRENMILGAMNNGIYEGIIPELRDFSTTLYALIGIEACDGLFAAMVGGDSENLLEKASAGALTGALITLSSSTVDTHFGPLLESTFREVIGSPNPASAVNQTASEKQEL